MQITTPITYLKYQKIEKKKTKYASKRLPGCMLSEAK